MTAQDLNDVWTDRLMSIKHPRFHFIVNDSLKFQPERENVSHIMDSIAPANKKELESRLVHMQMNRWDLKDSLWYMKVANDGKNESLLLFKGHHALADGSSMISTLADLFDEREELQKYAETQRKQFLLRRQRRKSRNLLERLWRYWVRLVKILFGMCVAVSYHLSLIVLNAFWDPNPWRKLFDANRRKRSLAWTSFAPLDQVKTVAAAFGPRVTVNDVMIYCVTKALRQQLQNHAKVQGDNFPKGNGFHIAMPVHLGGTTGNNIGAIVSRVHYDDDLTSIHQSLSFIKQTPMALLSYAAARLLSSIASASWFSTSNAGSIAVVSNNRGPPMKVHLQGRELEEAVGFVPLPPGIPIGVTVQSYAGKVNCSLTAEEWAVPDTEEFLVWMLQAYKDIVVEANLKREQRTQGSGISSP